MEEQAFLARFSMTSDEADEQARSSRKRARRKGEGDDDGAGTGKKARGRPRVDGQDGDGTAKDVSYFLHFFSY